MEIELDKEILEEQIENEIKLGGHNSTFDKLKKIQLLIKEESSLKEICNKKYSFK